MIHRAAAIAGLLASSSAFAGEPDPSEPIGSEVALGTAGAFVGLGVGLAGGAALGKAVCGESLDCIGYAVVGLGVGAAVGLGGGIAYGGNHNGRTGSYAATIGGTVIGAGAGIGVMLLAIASTEDHDHPDRNMLPLAIGGTALTVLTGYTGGLLGYHLSSEASTATVTAMPIAHGGGLAVIGSF